MIINDIGINQVYCCCIKLDATHFNVSSRHFLFTGSTSFPSALEVFQFHDYALYKFTIDIVLTTDLPLISNGDISAVPSGVHASFCPSFPPPLIWSVHRVRKKRVWSISGTTSSNTDRFLKFFYCYNLQEICNKAVVKYPTTP